MCDGRVDFPRIEADHGVRFNDYFAEALQLDEQVADGLLLIQADALQLLPKGQLMVRSVAWPLTPTWAAHTKASFPARFEWIGLYPLWALDSAHRGFSFQSLFSVMCLRQIQPCCPRCTCPTVCSSGCA